MHHGPVTWAQDAATSMHDRPGRPAAELFPLRPEKLAFLAVAIRMSAGHRRLGYINSRLQMAPRGGWGRWLVI
jgi:hypothetical protein